MKKKLLIAFAGLVVLFVAAAVVLPMFFKDAIATKVKAEINKRVNATVNFSDLSLTLLTSFPRMTVSLSDLSVTGINEFAGQPLANTKSLNLELSLWDLIGGKTTINSITLDSPVVNVIVLKNGKANYDIMKPEPPGSENEPSSFSMAVQSYAINDGRVSYDDRAGGLKFTLDNVDHSGSGDFTTDLFTLVTKTTVERANLWQGGVRYLTDTKTTLDSNLHVDLKNYKFTAKESVLALNELKLNLDGFVAMPGKDIDVDLEWSAPQNDFKNFMSLVPGVYREGFDDVVASGALAMNGFVKGRYTATRIPGFGLNLSVKNGSFKYPKLPSAVTNANLELAMTNPDGVPDHTVVDLKQLHAELGGEPIDARLRLATPVSDPQIDAMAKGTVNLGNVKSYIPLDKGTDLSGVVKADVTMKGRYAAVANKQVEALNAAGTVSVSNVRYSGEGVPPTTIRTMQLTFNPANATLNTLDASVGKSQITANGSLDNLPAYYFKNELLRGQLNVSSPMLDLNELRTGVPASGGSGTSSMGGGVIVLPANVDLAAQADIAKVLYDNVAIENVKGVVTLKDQVLDMKGLTFTMLNGTVAMSGQYATPNPARPQIAYNLKIGELDIQQTARTFDTVRTLAPIAERAKGLFSAELNVTGLLDEKNRPINNSINGRGKLTTNGVSVANFEPLNKIADALKLGDFKDIPLPRTVIQFIVKEGRVITEPFETTLAGTAARIEGSSGVDQSLDYTIGLAIPRDKLKGPALNAVNDLLGKVGNLAGTSVQLPDPVKVNLQLGGTVPSPTVKLALASGPGANTGSVGDVLKDKVQDALKDKAPDKVSGLADPAAAEKAKAEALAKAIAEAEAQAQQIRDAAKETADGIKKEGYEQADKLVAQAGGNPIKKALAQKAASALRKETDQKAQKIVDDGNANANKLVEEAKKKGGT
jgi:uncharacterized protein involved in outer membrane biogenesis/vacuolar-type H+-ATPase subunit H